MKRYIAIILLIFLILSMIFPGCQLGNDMKEPVTFYYKRAKFVYGTEDAVIASEQREASGHREDLHYLLSLYLQGPINEELTHSFPDKCQVVDISRKDKTLAITLNAPFAQLKNMDLTIAAACLTKTCMNLADVESVVIGCVAPDDTELLKMKIGKEDLLLYDNTAPIPLETEAKE